MRRVNLLHAHGSPTQYQYQRGCHCTACQSVAVAYRRRYYDTVRGPETTGRPTNIETPSECRRRLRRANRTETAAQRSRRVKYGLTASQWDALFAGQGGRCAICGTAEPKSGNGWATDHCHEAGTVRGILCPQCNSGLGFFRDNLTYLAAAIEYLQAAS